MQVRHPRYGVGRIKALTEHTADITFDDAPRTVDPATSELSPAEPSASLTEMQVPLSALIRETAQAVVGALGLEKADQVVEGLATRWQRGTLALKPADESLQAKEMPLETFFHKIVMIRNNLRVLEQKVNASDKLSDADKFDLQQYITRCYGSLTTFNVLFKEKEDQFGSYASSLTRPIAFQAVGSLLEQRIDRQDACRPSQAGSLTSDNHRLGVHELAYA